MSLAIDRLTPEIRRLIVQHLDFGTVRQLATLSRSWQDAAESVLWRSIWSVPSTMANSISEIVLNQIEGDNLPLIHECPKVARTCVTADSIACYVQASSVHTGLKDRPARFAYVRKLHISGCSATADIVYELCRMVSPNLTYLTISCHEGASRLSKADLYDTVSQLATADFPFPNLTSLALDVAQKDLGQSLAILKRMPRLETLQVYVDFSGESPSVTSTPILMESKIRSVALELPIHNIGDIPTAVWTSRHLEQFRMVIRDTDDDDSYGEFENLGPMCQVKCASVRTYYEHSEKALRALFDNRFTALRLLEIIVDLRPDTFMWLPPVSQLNVECVQDDWTLHSFADHAKTHRILDEYAHHIQQFPSLEILRTVRVDDPALYLFRTYVDPATSEQFHHYRCLELPADLEIEFGVKGFDLTDPKYAIVLHTSTWRTATYYRGAAVSWEGLARMYSQMRERLDWLEPGRNLSMPAEAWAVLRKDTRDRIRADS